MLNDWEVAQWLSVPPYPYEVHHGEQFCATIAENHAAERATLFAIARTEDDEVIGSIEISPGNPSSCGVGYWMGRKHWGQGYAREALAALIDYGTVSFGVRKLIALVDPENTPSCKLLMHSGFSFGSTTQLSSPTRRGCLKLHLYARSLTGASA